MPLYAETEPTLADEKQALRRATSELEAARARVARDQARVLEETRSELLVELLPVLDNVERSIAAGAGDPAALEGMRLVKAQLEGVLRGYGLERFGTIGERFDPRRHEAMAVAEVSDPALDGAVIEQWQPGFATAGRLRPARVTVGRYRDRAV